MEAVFVNAYSLMETTVEGIRTETKEQPLKAFSPMNCNPSLRAMEVSDAHPINVSSPSSVNPLGRATEVSDVHPENARDIMFSLEGRTMDSNEVHPLKVPSIQLILSFSVTSHRAVQLKNVQLRFVTFAGMDMAAKELQLQNARKPSVSNDSGKLMVTIAAQLSKALLSMALSELGSCTEASEEQP